MNSTWNCNIFVCVDNCSHRKQRQEAEEEEER